jgi:hypothetical protein
LPQYKIVVVEVIVVVAVVVKDVFVRWKEEIPVNNCHGKKGVSLKMTSHDDDAEISTILMKTKQNKTWAKKIHSLGFLIRTDGFKLDYD